jgi:hypothetical protein
LPRGASNVQGRAGELEATNYNLQFVYDGFALPAVCFTEHRVSMLASVLNSEGAIGVNIQIVRIFIRLREMLASHKEVLDRFERMERGFKDHDEQIVVILEFLNQSEQNRQKESDQENRRRIGFKREGEP